jgi:hypothetical protein
MTRNLYQDEKELLANVIIYGQKHRSGSNKNGYVGYRYNGKTYKRSRVTYQLFHNVFLYPDELIHHKNEDKSDDHIVNLELITTEQHCSLHHAGKRRIRRKIEKKPKKSKEWFKNNKERIKKRSALYYLQNKDKIIKKKKEYYEKNKKKCYERNKKYRQEKKEKLKNKGGN